MKENVPRISQGGKENEKEITALLKEVDCDNDNIESYCEMLKEMFLISSGDN